MTPQPVEEPMTPQPVEEAPEPAGEEPATLSTILLERSGDHSTGLENDDGSFTWDQVVQASADRARWLESIRTDGPFHVGVLLDNTPEFAFLLGAASLSGAVIVGLNPTRRGAALVRDVTHADCQVIVTERRHLELLDQDALEIAAERVFVVDDPSWSTTLAPFADSPRTAVAADERDLAMLVFTSGTSGEPKAVRMTQRNLLSMANRARKVPPSADLPMMMRPDDVSYLAMPMFHSACVIVGWFPAVAIGAHVVLRRRFSASGFLVDVRRYGVTFFHYVGRPLSYVLATPERPDDADNTLRVATGNEGAPQDLERFAERFGCAVIDSFGSSEIGVTLGSGPNTPKGAIGALNDEIDILDPATGESVPAARLDTQGRVVNFDEAVGELVNTKGPGLFEGYYKNEAADAERMRDGMYWSGDLAYHDENGFVYFAGRTMDWIRVDGENFGAASVEMVLLRYEWAALVAVFAVADANVGDQVMAVLEPGDESGPFDPDDFAEFLFAQTDLGTKWPPRYVRITEHMPATATNKVLKRSLAREAWEAPQVYLRDGDTYRLMTDADRDALRAEFAEHGNTHRLPQAAL